MSIDGIGSPDLPGYVDLTLYDVDPQELVDRALDDGTTKIEGWVPREGNTEVVLIESLALIVDELVFAINRLPATVLEGLLGRFELQRDQGAPTLGSATFTLADTLNHTIPAGTTVRAVVPATEETVDFTTDEPLEILAGAGAGTVAITATEIGVSANGLPASTPLELVDSVPYVETVAVASTLSGGRDIEEDSAFYDRGSARLSRLVAVLVLAEHFTAAALEHPGVGRATTIDLYNPDGGTPGEDGGHVTVAVADQDGAPLGSGPRADLEASLTAQASAGLEVHVVDPTVTAVDVEAEVVTKAGYDASTVIANVEAALTSYLSPATWGWGGTVYRFELVSLIDQVEGVERVASITDPAADVALSGAAPLADAGTLSITVA